MTHSYIEKIKKMEDEIADYIHRMVRTFALRTPTEKSTPKYIDDIFSRDLNYCERRETFTISGSKYVLEAALKKFDIKLAKDNHIIIMSDWESACDSDSDDYIIKIKLIQLKCMLPHMKHPYSTEREAI